MLDTTYLNLEHILNSCSKNAQSIIKKRLNLPDKVEILSTPDKILQALELRYNSYQQTPFKHHFSNPLKLLFSDADSTSIILGYYDTKSLDLKSKLLGTLSLDISSQLKSEKLGLELFELRKRGVSLAELHGLVIDKSVCRRAFKPLFHSMELIGKELEVESYVMVMREELTKLYRNFDKIETFKELDSFMGINIAQKALIYTPQQTQTYTNIGGEK